MALLAGQDLPPDDDNRSAGEVSNSADSGRGPSIGQVGGGGVGGGQHVTECDHSARDDYCYCSSEHDLQHLSPRAVRTYILQGPEQV